MASSVHMWRSIAGHWAVRIGSIVAMIVAVAGCSGDEAPSCAADGSAEVRGASRDAIAQPSRGSRYLQYTAWTLDMDREARVRLLLRDVPEPLAPAPVANVEPVKIWYRRCGHTGVESWSIRRSDCTPVLLARNGRWAWRDEERVWHLSAQVPDGLWKKAFVLSPDLLEVFIGGWRGGSAPDWVGKESDEGSGLRRLLASVRGDEARQWVLSGVIPWYSANRVFVVSGLHSGPVAESSKLLGDPHLQIEMDVDPVFERNRFTALQVVVFDSKAVGDSRTESKPQEVCVGKLTVSEVAEGEWGGWTADDWPPFVKSWLWSR